MEQGVIEGSIRVTELQKLEWGPDDIGILRYPRRLTKAEFAGIREAVKKAFPGRTMLVLEENADFHVVHCWDIDDKPASCSEPPFGSGAERGEE